MRTAPTVTAWLWLALACNAGAAGGDPVNDVRGQAAKQLGVKESTVEVTPLDATVPGLQLFGAEAASSGQRRFVAGAVLASGQVVVGGDAVRKAIFDAWAWSPGKVPPATVAAVVTRTLEMEEPARVVSEPADVTYLGRLGVEGVALPHEETRGGDPAVVWWVGTGSNPATEVILQVTGGVPKLSTGRTHGGG